MFFYTRNQRIFSAKFWLRRSRKPSFMKFWTSELSCWISASCIAFCLVSKMQPLSLRLKGKNSSMGYVSPHTPHSPPLQIYSCSISSSVIYHLHSVVCSLSLQETSEGRSACTTILKLKRSRVGERYRVISEKLKEKYRSYNFSLSFLFYISHTSHLLFSWKTPLFSLEILSLGNDSANHFFWCENIFHMSWSRDTSLFFR